MRWQSIRDSMTAMTRHLLRSAYLMWLLARDRRVPWAARCAAAGAGGYVCMPFNVIPDYIPVIGELDDVAVVWFGLWLARRLVPAKLIAEHRETASNRFPVADLRTRSTAPSPNPPHARDKAFGVDPVRRELYSLRQSRYDALAQDVSDWASNLADGNRARLLIIGCGIGTELRYLEGKQHFRGLSISGTNIDDQIHYRREAYDEIFIGDLLHGYPEIRSDCYDIVVCEQVLEHLDEIEVAMATLGRVLKPGGKAIVGVPIFPPPLHLVRKHIVPRIDGAMAHRRSRGHRQAFSLASFVKAMRMYSGLTLLKVRGFRMISGGLLRRLENYRWWWRANRRLGELAPALCIEIQVIMEKPLAGNASTDRRHVRC